MALAAKAAAAGDHGFAVAVVQAGLEHENALPALQVVMAHHDGVGGFAGAHRAVAEVELGHGNQPPGKVVELFDAQLCRKVLGTLRRVAVAGQGGEEIVGALQIAAAFQGVGLIVLGVAQVGLAFHGLIGAA